MPPKPAKNPENRGRELEPKRGDSEAVLAWKQRMASEEGKEIYKATSGDERNGQRRPAKLSRAEPDHGARAGTRPSAWRCGARWPTT